MDVNLGRIILFVQDVDRLANFYRTMFGLVPAEEIAGEWVVLRAGVCELALHRVGPAYRVADPSNWKVETNAKLVLTVDRDLAAFRAELVAKGVAIRELKSFAGTGRLCDGEDPEGNVFQLAEAPPVGR